MNLQIFEKDEFGKIRTGLKDEVVLFVAVDV